MDVVGRCVAITMCMPTARASCAIRAIGNSISLPAVIIKSPNSSITTTMYGMNLCPFCGLSCRSLNFLLYSLILRAPAIFSRSYLVSISLHSEFRVRTTLVTSVMIGSAPSSGTIARKCFSNGV